MSAVTLRVARSEPCPWGANRCSIVKGRGGCTQDDRTGLCQGDGTRMVITGEDPTTLFVRFLNETSDAGEVAAVLAAARFDDWLQSLPAFKDL